VEALAQTIFPILLIGGSQALINFSPGLTSNLKKKLFNFNIISILFLSVSGIVILLILSYIPTFNGLKYVYFSFATAVCLAFVELFKKQATIIQKIAIPTFFDNIIPKLTLPLLFLFVLYGMVSKNQSLFFFVGSSVLVLFLSATYLYKKWRPNSDLDFASLFNSINKKDYYKFCFFAFAGSLGSVFAFRLDALLIPKLLNMEALGTFSIGVTLASALAIPATGIFILYAPIVSNNLKNNNLISLNKDYKAVAKFLFFMGMLLYSCVFLGIENLFSLLPTAENLLPSVPIILILGLNVVINMGTGFNGEIITYSRFYKFNLVAILLLAILNIVLILTFVKFFDGGIQSIAIASLISMVIFNVVKLVFIYKKLALWPFDYSYLKLVVVFVVVLFLVHYVPDVEKDFYNLIFKCGLCLITNIVLIYKLKLVFQFHSKVDLLIAKFKQL
jgi:O-antigen/teichoic acid export membrane protein